MSDFERLYNESKIGEPCLLANNVMVGCVYGKKFIKRIHNKHLMAKPPAIAIDRDIFMRMIRPNCDRIFVLNMDTQDFYGVSVDQFASKSFPVDREFGRQLGLEMMYWTKNTGVTHQVAMF